jgi:Zn-dependent protease
MLLVVTGVLGGAVPALGETLGIVQAMLFFGVVLNAVLIAFNLLPIPPLDGSHVFKYLLPPKVAVHYVRFGRFGLLALVVLLQWGGDALRVWMSPVLGAAYAGIESVNRFILPTTEQWLR